VIFAQALLERTEHRRRRIWAELDPGRRTALGQVFTPGAVAEFLASLIDLPKSGTFTVLDPGAGIGSLSVAVVARAMREAPGIDLHLVSFELDERLIGPLEETLDDCRAAAAHENVSVTAHVVTGNFLTWASAVASGDEARGVPPLNACVMNPPYRKINNGDAERLAVERLGLRVTNLYPAFLALAAAILEPGGQLSAITPRSFANGTYFRPFREFFLGLMALERLHVYESRGAVFGDSDVLQENVVFRATRGGARNTVVLSVSHGTNDARIEARTVPYAQVVHPNDPQCFVRIPIDAADALVAERIAALPCVLGEIGLQVSTGRVVDFRAREHLRMVPEAGTVPLVYPGHLRASRIAWPSDGKKPNALASNNATEALLLPNENYVLVKRFTSKEERRRVVAALASREDLPGEHVAFENHLNVFHLDSRGLDRATAVGLVCFLNCTLVDVYVRQFSGHTQINAGDLRHLRYPSAAELRSIGVAVGEDPIPADQAEVDQLVACHIPAFDDPTLHAALREVA
jgi:adenine-specific DNA-methyltransferase